MNSSRMRLCKDLLCVSLNPTSGFLTRRPRGLSKNEEFISKSVEKTVFIKTGDGNPGNLIYNMKPLAPASQKHLPTSNERTLSPKYNAYVQTGTAHTTYILN